MAKPLIRDCNLGFGIRVREGADGRGDIFVAEQIIGPGYDGPALREFMERIAVSWLDQVAPHRLATDPIMPWQ